MAQIEERELNYYTNNALTVGTQAALLAGFAFTGIIEAPWDFFQDMNVPYPVRALCVISTLLGMIFEILAIVKSVQISILGPGLALRGSEGSMTRALSVMRHEQRRLHWQFYIGLFFFHLATGAFCSGLFFAIDPSTAIICIVTLCLSFTWMCLDCKSVATQLWLPPAASLWRGEVDRRPLTKQSVRCSCTGAVVPPGVPSSELSGRLPAAPNGNGKASQKGGMRRAAGKIGQIKRAGLPDPLSGSFRLPRHEALSSPMAGAPHPLNERGKCAHSDEYIVRHLISATMRDWTAQQAAQWHSRGVSALQALDFWRPGGGRNRERDALLVSQGIMTPSPGGRQSRCYPALGVHSAGSSPGDRSPWLVAAPAPSTGPRPSPITCSRPPLPFSAAQQSALSGPDRSGDQPVLSREDSRGRLRVSYAAVDDVAPSVPPRQPHIVVQRRSLGSQRARPTEQQTPPVRRRLSPALFSNSSSRYAMRRATSAAGGQSVNASGGREDASAAARVSADLQAMDLVSATAVAAAAVDAADNPTQAAADPPLTSALSRLSEGDESGGEAASTAIVEARSRAIVPAPGLDRPSVTSSPTAIRPIPPPSRTPTLRASAAGGSCALAGPSTPGEPSMSREASSSIGQEPSVTENLANFFVQVNSRLGLREMP